MALNQFFSASFILHQVVIQSKEDLLFRFADKAYNTNLISNKQQLYDDLIAQEQQSASGMEQGVAISHLRTDLTRKSFVMLATLKEAIDFGALDNTLSNIVVLLCSPINETHIYIQLLSRISRLLQDAENRQTILSAIGPNALYQFIEARGNWDIVLEKPERYLLNLMLFQPEYLDAVVDSFFELGLLRAQVTESIPLRKLISKNRSLLNLTEGGTLKSPEKTYQISCIVSDKETVKALYGLLNIRQINLNEPGVGLLSLSRIENMVGDLQENYDFLDR